MLGTYMVVNKSVSLKTRSLHLTVKSQKDFSTYSSIRKERWNLPEGFSFYKVCVTNQLSKPNRPVS